MIPRRRTLRTQLTLLYAVPFFASGALLVTAPLLGTRESAPAGTTPGVAPVPTHTVQFPVTLWALSMLALILVSLVLGWLVAGRFLRPLRTITATARDISATNLHRRLESTGRADEFAELAVTLNALFERLEAAFASQRRFVANASHELRTPLAAGRTVLQVALADPERTVGSLEVACHEALALGAAQERLIDSLLTLAGGEQGIERGEPFDLSEVARRVLDSRRCDELTVRADLAPGPAWGDPQLAESLVANLVDNAIRHNAPGGRVDVATAPAAGGARILVSNSGPIVPPGEIDRLFEPFQQLDQQRTRHGDGYGLGLAIVRAIADAHRAELDARARPAGGLDVAVTFPRPDM